MIQQILIAYLKGKLISAHRARLYSLKRLKEFLLHQIDFSFFVCSRRIKFKYDEGYNLVC
jgi:hypothetical protein